MVFVQNKTIDMFMLYFRRGLRVRGRLPLSCLHLFLRRWSPGVELYLPKASAKPIEKVSISDF